MSLLPQIEKETLPEGWQLKTLGEYVSKRGKGITPNRTPEEIFELYSVPSHEVGHPEIIAGGEIGSNKQIVEDGMVLLCKINPRINRSWVVSSHTEHQNIASTEWIQFPPSDDYDPKYLKYYLNQEALRSFLAANASGVGGSLTRVKPATVKDYPFPIAPLEDQKRIVAEIEKQFSRLDEAVDSLKRVKANLKRYKAAVLKAAVEGKLTEEWRKQNPDVEPASKLLERILAERRTKWEETELAKMKAKGKEPKNDKWKEKYKGPQETTADEFPGMPSGWDWIGIEQAATHIVDCLHSTAKFVDEGELCVDTNCMSEGAIVFEDVRYVSKETYVDRVRRLEPMVDDVLFSREGTIGLAALVPENLRLCLGQRMMLFRPAKCWRPEFFLWAILSEVFRKQWQKAVTGTTSPHINIGDVRKMGLPLPPIDEQDQIVVEIDRLLSVNDQLMQEVEIGLRRAANLRQSILSVGFSGTM